MHVQTSKGDNYICTSLETRDNSLRVPYSELVLCCTYSTRYYVIKHNVSANFSQILGKGGTFVCRCYELLTRFSAGVLFVAYKLFREVHIHLALYMMYLKS